MKVMLSWIVLAVSVMGTRGSGRVHCTVSASPVAVGQFVSITCHFSPDLRGKELRVYRTNQGDDSGPQTTVSSCTWRSSSASHVCETKQPGYRWQHANSKVRLVIPGVRKAHEGEYSCQLVDHMPDSTTPCRLEVNVTGFETSCDAPPVAEGEPGKIICRFNEDLTEVKAEFSVIWQPLVADGHDTAIVALDCFWSDGGLNCTPYAGYTIETSEISSTLTLGMAKSSEGQEGRYRCKVSSSLPGKETPCDFRLKDRHNETERGDEKCPAVNTTTILVLNIFFFLVLFATTSGILYNGRSSQAARFAAVPTTNSFAQELHHTIKNVH